MGDDSTSNGGMQGRVGNRLLVSLYTPSNNVLGGGDVTDSSMTTAVNLGVPVDGGTYTKLAAVEDAGVRDYRFSPDGATIYMLVGAAEDKQRTKRQHTVVIQLAQYLRQTLQHNRPHNNSRDAAHTSDDDDAQYENPNFIKYRFIENPRKIENLA